jgi:hypothetical protein
VATNPKRTNAAATAACDAMAVLANGGFLDIYDGAQPATADTAVGAQVKLASLPLSATAFAGAVNGVATANAITSDASADATGTAAWFRVFKSDHTTAVWDGSVGTAAADLVLNSTAIQIGAQVSVTSLTLTEAK